MLTVIVGPMMAGKTSELLSMCRSNQIAGNKTLLFKPSIDNRFDDNAVVTHDGKKMNAIKLNNQNALSLFDDHSDWLRRSEYGLVAFDEVQFFNADLIEVIDTLIRYCDVDVVCAGLAQDSSGKPFGIMPRLLCMADKIISLTAVCSKCKEIGAATRTFRKVEGNKQVEVGGSDKYEARCLPCWSFDQ